MAERNKSEPLAFLATANSLTRIDAFFDKLEHIVERISLLLMKAKYLFFGLAFLLFLIYEILLFGKHLLSYWR